MDQILRDLAGDNRDKALQTLARFASSDAFDARAVATRVQHCFQEARELGEAVSALVQAQNSNFIHLVSHIACNVETRAVRVCVVTEIRDQLPELHEDFARALLSILSPRLVDCYLETLLWPELNDDSVRDWNGLGPTLSAVVEEDPSSVQLSLQTTEAVGLPPERLVEAVVRHHAFSRRQGTAQTRDALQLLRDFSRDSAATAAIVASTIADPTTVGALFCAIYCPAETPTDFLITLGDASNGALVDALIDEGALPTVLQTATGDEQVWLLAQLRERVMVRATEQVLPPAGDFIMDLHRLGLLERVFNDDDFITRLATVEHPEDSILKFSADHAERTATLVQAIVCARAPLIRDSLSQAIGHHFLQTLDYPYPTGVLAAALRNLWHWRPLTAADGNQVAHTLTELETSKREEVQRIVDIAACCRIPMKKIESTVCRTGLPTELQRRLLDSVRWQLRPGTSTSFCVWIGSGERNLDRQYPGVVVEVRRGPSTLRFEIKHALAELPALHPVPARWRADSGRLIVGVGPSHAPAKYRRAIDRLQAGARKRWDGREGGDILEWAEVFFRAAEAWPELNDDELVAIAADAAFHRSQQAHRSGIPRIEKFGYKSIDPHPMFELSFGQWREASDVPAEVALAFKGFLRSEFQRRKAGRQKGYLPFGHVCARWKDNKGRIWICSYLSHVLGVWPVWEAAVGDRRIPATKRSTAGAESPPGQRRRTPQT